VGRSLSFADICERGEVEVGIPFMWVLLYEVCMHVAREVHTRPGWETEAKRLAYRISEVISDDVVVNSAMSMYALLVVLFAYLAVAVETGALEVVSMGGGDGGCQSATWLS
jgi:hypothetical protein